MTSSRAQLRLTNEVKKQPAVTARDLKASLVQIDYSGTTQNKSLHTKRTLLYFSKEHINTPQW
uniref:Uncharacterized protein n=2 Tax=Astyanax mexicanus TaxID=7994 RepID=A0A3B1IQ68_ASTMX